MYGYVMLINRREKLAAIKTEDGRYSVLKVLQGEISVGDILHGELQTLGQVQLENVSSESAMEALIHDAKGVVAAKTKYLIGMDR